MFSIVSLHLKLIAYPFQISVYVTWSDRTSLITRNTPMRIMVSISCSVSAIQILYVLLNCLGFLLATW